MQRHRHQEFLRFLNKIARETPAALDVHVILDNYGTHKHPKTVAWLKRHPRAGYPTTPSHFARSRRSGPGDFGCSASAHSGTRGRQRNPNPDRSWNRPAPPADS
jgi:hypothetical protein